MKPTTKPKLLLIGNPNSGKTLLFNRLTGLRKKVANFPGITVEIASGYSEVLGADILDFPGIYSLSSLTRDEEVAVAGLVKQLKTKQSQICICVLDVTRLERSLFLFLQLRSLCASNNVPLVMLLNMVDQLAPHKIKFDSGLLERELGYPVVLLSAKTREGFERLALVCGEALKSKPSIMDIGSLSEVDSNQLKILAKQLSTKVGLRGDLLLKTQYQIDHFVLAKGFGTLIFFATMLFLFQAIFSWAAPFMDAVEAAISYAANFMLPKLPEGVIRDFVNGAIFGGFGSFLVFVPQIFILTLIIGFLEDSGYLARAALICHRPLSYFGLSGRSFIPLMTGHACAIPAILSARSIESPKKRMLTMMVIPLVACSARLPVYGLFIAAIIPTRTILGGLLGLQGLAFFVLYFFGILMALLVAALASKSLFRNETEAPFVLELPPYRWPNLGSLIKIAVGQSATFVTRAGPIIFMVTMVVWILGYFPLHGSLENSYLSAIGRWIEPVFIPLGVDWKFGVAIMTSFLAREVFVGTLGTMFGIQGADENFSGLATKLQQSGMSFASGVALLVFYALAMQCVATLAILKKEMGAWKYPAIVFGGYSLLAYVSAVLAYWILK